MRNLLVAAAAIAAAVVLFLVLRPDEEDEPSSSDPASTQVTETEVSQPPQPPPPRPAQVRIAVEGGTPVGGVRRVTVRKGRQVVLLVTSDVSDHLHLHGYDVKRDVAPGQPARLAFRATIAGTVEAELEESGVRIAAITAKP
ncbi:MAG: hypothetical protein H0V79_10480 [Actinobacteria bacterium]|nr:hypothetical protein [Actinomycetota bacterium]